MNTPQCGKFRLASGPMRSLKRSEKALQQSIVEVLEMHGWVVLEYGKPGARGPLQRIARLLTQYHVPQPVIQVILTLIAGLGGKVPVGHTDLLAVKSGRPPWFIEVKLPGRHPTEEQSAFLMQMSHYDVGALAGTVTCIEDVLGVLQALGDEVRVEVR